MEWVMRLLSFSLRLVIEIHDLFSVWRDHEPDKERAVLSFHPFSPQQAQAKQL